MLQGKRILLVEDEAILAALINDVLCDENAVVIGPAGSVIRAIEITKEALREGGLDAAILDINIAGEPVWPVVDILRRNEIPYVFQTGYTEFRSDARVLHKPYSSTDLIGAVEDVTKTAFVGG